MTLCVPQYAGQVQRSLEAAGQGEVHVKTDVCTFAPTCNAAPTHTGRPAGELDELHLVGAPEQGVPVVDEDGRADEELKGELYVDGSGFCRWFILCEREKQ